jgi:ATP-dependent DNA ligase
MLWRSSAPARRPEGFIEPCLPMLADSVPSGPQWVHEIKHDGFRFICRREGNRIRVFSRRERAAAARAAEAKRAEAERKAIAEAEKIVAIWNARQAGGRALWFYPTIGVAIAAGLPWVSFSCPGVRAVRVG